MNAFSNNNQVVTGLKHCLGLFILFDVYECFTHTYICACSCLMYTGVRRGHRPLGLELQMVVSYQVGAGI